MGGCYEQTLCELFGTVQSSIQQQNVPAGVRADAVRPGRGVPLAQARGGGRQGRRVLTIAVQRPHRRALLLHLGAGARRRDPMGHPLPPTPTPTDLTITPLPQLDAPHRPENPCPFVIQQK
ncbi:jg16236 [Pararge aegeria aegeria]|uniref:Jg16236 protein n=1 Tax=Pararge aegeria aegeria TaxID=348720 RepID=A0A8S4RXB4_9NEOP|nr:jg16236 [Pararge aegeria aegeria]